jgi:diaminopimelate epimerase
MTFYKYHGTGNDFIIVNGISNPELLDISNQQVAYLCDRHFGIGADGFMILAESTISDFKMIYYNSDGNTSTMCGNGGRCITKFAFTEQICQKDISFEAIDGLHHAKIQDNGEVELEMIDVVGFKKLSDDTYEIQTGSPHYVHFIKSIDQKEIVDYGSAIRYSDRYAKDGINVNTATLLDENLHVRTYERGVEDETLSCGTGVTAAALCATDYYSLTDNVLHIDAKGGKLKVTFRKEGESFSKIKLIGPATFVFKGELVL